jgi:predicted PurR-regulated permease PerM
MDFTNHPFLNVMWTFFLVFIWLAWLWLLVTIAVDIFRRRDTSGWVKAVWLIFIVFLPFLGVLIYLITQGDGMGQRQMEHVQQQQRQFDSYVRERAGSAGAAAEIEKAKALLDAGTITPAEFDQIKAKALG